jgi:hypothetical protein
MLYRDCTIGTRLVGRLTTKDPLERVSVEEILNVGQSVSAIVGENGRQEHTIRDGMMSYLSI